MTWWQWLTQTAKMHTSSMVRMKVSGCHNCHALTRFFHESFIKIVFLVPSVQISKACHVQILSASCKHLTWIGSQFLFLKDEKSVNWKQSLMTKLCKRFPYDNNILPAPVIIITSYLLKEVLLWCNQALPWKYLKVYCSRNSQMVAKF